MEHLIFLAVPVVAAIVVFVALHGKGEAAFKATLEQLQAQGYVVTRTGTRYTRQVTLIWGRYAQPVPFYLRASARDVVASAAGQLGMADMKVGHEGFDRIYVVRSHHPKWARAFLTPARCEKFLAAGAVEFIVSSIDNLLTPDYWPDEEARDLREIWMLRVDGTPEGERLAQHIELAQSLAADVQAFCKGLDHSPADLRAGSFEGR